MAIKSIRHDGLRALFERGDSAALEPKLAVRLLWALNFLHAADRVADARWLPGFRAMTIGRKPGFGIRIGERWLMTFAFSDDDEPGFADIDLVDMER